MKTNVLKTLMVLIALLAFCIGCSRAAHDPKSMYSPPDFGQISRRHGKDLSAMIASLREAIAKDPKNDELHYVLAHGLRARGDTQGFFHEMNTAISLAPRSSMYRWIIAEGYRRQGNRRAALDNALIAARLGVNDATTMVPGYNKLAADLLNEEGRYQEAERTYEKALAQLSAYAQDIISPIHPDASLLHCARFENEIKHKLSVIREKPALERPTQAWIRKDMPWVPFMFVRDEKTIAASKAYIAKTAPEVRSGKLGGSQIHGFLGSRYLIIDDAQHAVIECLATIELCPKNAIDWQMLGAAYLMQNRLGDAANAYHKAYNLGDKASLTLSQKMLESMRRFDKSRKTLGGRI